MRLVHKSGSPAATRITPRPRIALGAAVGLVTALLLTAILSVDLLPRVYEVREGDVAAMTIKASRKQSYVSQILSGHRPVSKEAAYKLAEFFRVSAYSFI